MTLAQQREIGLELDPMPRSLAEGCPYCGQWCGGTHRCEGDANDDEWNSSMQRAQELLRGRGR